MIKVFQTFVGLAVSEVGGIWSRSIWQKSAVVVCHLRQEFFASMLDIDLADRTSHQAAVASCSWKILQSFFREFVQTCVPRKHTSPISLIMIYHPNIIFLYSNPYIITLLFCHSSSDSDSNIFQLNFVSLTFFKSPALF